MLFVDIQPHAQCPLSSLEDNYCEVKVYDGADGGWFDTFEATNDTGIYSHDDPVECTIM